MLFELDNNSYRGPNAVGVRLEDIKKHPEKTLKALCKWMDITETESLYEMTALGNKWWGDPSSSDYSKDGMNPFGKVSINRKVGSIFSENDQFILRTLFYPFRRRFGYTDQSFRQFQIDLKTVKPMINCMFDFEKTIVQETNGDTEQFMRSGSFLFLRAGLLERWNTLNAFGSYRNLIQPLRID